MDVGNATRALGEIASRKDTNAESTIRDAFLNRIQGQCADVGNSLDQVTGPSRDLYTLGESLKDENKKITSPLWQKADAYQIDANDPGVTKGIWDYVNRLEGEPTSKANLISKRLGENPFQVNPVAPGEKFVFNPVTQVLEYQATPGSRGLPNMAYLHDLERVAQDRGYNTYGEGNQGGFTPEGQANIQAGGGLDRYLKSMSPEYAAAKKASAEAAQNMEALREKGPALFGSRGMRGG